MDEIHLHRFMAKVVVEDGGCWTWVGARTGKGYGNFAVNGKSMVAHRLAYEHFVGPIPDGRQLDHLCRVRHCVNPSHLEPVTNRENSRRGAKGDLVTHCKSGHEFTPENTYWRKEGRRMCRECLRIRSIANNARSRELRTRQYSPEAMEASRDKRRAKRQSHRLPR